MRYHIRNLSILIVIVISFGLGSGPTFFATHGLAEGQKSGGAKESSNPKGSGPTTNSDSSTTRSKPDDTYARGGTKETTVDKDGKTVEREVWRGKNGNPVRAKGKNGIAPVEIEWKYDARGTLVKVLAKYAEGSRVSIQKGYKDENDTEGTTHVSSYNSDSAESVKRFMDSFAPGAVTFAVIPPEKQEKQGLPKTDSPPQEISQQSAANIIPTAIEDVGDGELIGAAAKKPVLILTMNGEESAKIIGPAGANDLRIFWGVLTPYGYWTRNGVEIPKSRFQFLPAINDFHFSPNGRFAPMPPVAPPAGANDVEFRWEGDQIVEAWWTRNGQRMTRILLNADTQQFNFELSSERRQETAQGAATTQLVGVVYDRNSRPGDQVTMSITDDPKRYEKISGLGVKVLNVSVPRNPSGQANLAGVVVNPGNGPRQPANQPFTLRIPETANNVPISLTSQGDTTPSAQTDVPLQQGGANPAVANTGGPSDFITPPVCQDTSFIRGPLSGNANMTRIMVDNQAAAIIAESPATVYFDLPTGTSAGPHQLTILDGARSASFPIVRMGITGHIDQPSLLRKQKTNYSVTVHLESLPDSLWQRGGGMSPELVNPGEIQQLAPGFQIPQAGEPGVVFLTVTNGSPGVVRIKPLLLALHQQDFQNNQFTSGGEVQSERSGGFVLNLLAQAFFAPIRGQAAPGGGIASGPTPPEPTPRTVGRTFPEKLGSCSGSCPKPVPVQAGFDQVISCQGTGDCPKNCSCHLLRAKKANPDDPWEEVPKPASGKPPYDSAYEYYCLCAP